MDWEIIVTERYESWFLTLSDSEQVSVLAMVNVLEIKGPLLGRPYADTLNGTSNYKNIKELRVQHDRSPYRVLYAFDPKRRAVLLCGGRKDGSKAKRFYEHIIAIAEQEYSNYLLKSFPETED